MNKNIFVLLTVFLIGILVSYNFGFKRAIKTNEEYKKEIEVEVLKNNPIPVCELGKCPEYQTFDVDNDGEDENIVIQPIGMSQFAGQVLVIDEGKVTFISKGKMFISVRPTKEIENENGFIIGYSTEANARSNDVFEDAYYKYENGEYVLDKVVKNTD